MFIFWIMTSIKKITEKSNLNWDFYINIKLQHTIKKPRGRPQKIITALQVSNFKNKSQKKKITTSGCILNNFYS